MHIFSLIKDTKSKKILKAFTITLWFLFTFFYFLPIPLFVKGTFHIFFVASSSLYGGVKLGFLASCFFLLVRVLYHPVVPINLIGLWGGFFVGLIVTIFVGFPVDIINRKGEEYTDSLKLYRQLIESLHEGIWVIDKSGYTTYANQALAEMLGYSGSELIGKHYFDFMDDEGIEMAKYYQKRRSSGIKEQHEMKLFRKDGEWIYTLLETAPLFDGNGVYQGAIAGIQDITKRKEMEDELKKSRSILGTVFEKTKEGVNILNSDLTINQANNTIKRWFKDELPLEGKKCYEVFQKSENPCDPCPTLQAMKSGKMERREISVKREEGEMWFEIFSYPLQDPESNSTTHALEFVMDITPRKMMEEALVESERQFRAIFEVASVGIVQVDPRNGQMIRFNERYLQITGYTEEELLAMEFPDLTHPKDRQRDWELFSKAVKGESPYYQNEKRYIRKDGSVVWVRLNAAFIRDRKGHPFRTVAVCEDITQRIEAQESLAYRNEEMRELFLQLDREVEKARNIHEQILPVRFPEIESLTFASYYQPALRLGGDFYDVIKHGSKLILYLSDVSGHGLGSAMLSLFIKHTIKAFLAFTPPEWITPASILKFLADEFQGQNYPEEYFICIFVGILDLETMVLTYTGVGFQDSPLVLLGDGQRTRLSTRGFFLFSFPSSEKLKLREKTLTLTPSSILFFNTDGLTEEMTGNSFYRDRLEEVFFQNSYLPPHFLAQVVLEDFRSFNRGLLQGKDDVTFLIMQVKPKDEEQEQLFLQSDFLELDRLREKIFQLFQGRLAYGLLISLNELVINAIEHGNKFDTVKRIAITFTMKKEYVLVLVEDQGTGFNWRDKMNNPLDLTGEEERGRGIAMIQLCCDHLLYNEKGNQAMVMVKRTQSMEGDAL